MGFQAIMSVTRVCNTADRHNFEIKVRNVHDYFS